MATAGKVFTSVDGQVSGLEELERDAKALQRALENVRVTGESADGSVIATVGGRGELLELSLDPRIYRTQDCEGLAADILAAVRAGAEQARREVFKAARKLLPPTATAESADLEFDPFLQQLDRAKGGVRR